MWSHDGQHLLLSNILRFDQDGELLPFRPATAQPDGSEFNLLELPDFPFDGYCTAWSPDDQQILCGVGGDSPGVWSLSASDGGDAAEQSTTNPYGSGDFPSAFHLTEPRSPSSASDQPVRGTLRRRRRRH